MSFVMAAGLAACSSGGSTDTSAASGQDTQEASSGNGNTLVVYYSATGNTERAAQYIADATGGRHIRTGTGGSVY